MKNKSLKFVAKMTAMVLSFVCVFILSACSSGVKPASNNITEIVDDNDFIINNEEESYKSTPLEETYIVEKDLKVADKYGYKTTYSDVETTKLYGEINYRENLSTNYLGAVLWGQMNENGLELSPVQGQQPEIKISLFAPTAGISESQRVIEPSSSTVSKAISEMTKKLRKTKLTSKIECTNYAFNSKAELLSFFNINNLFSNKDEIGECYYAVVVKEHKYSVCTDRKDPNEYFNEVITEKKYNEITKETGKVPLYISQVDYGSICIFIFSSKTVSAESLENKIKLTSNPTSVESFVTSIAKSNVFENEEIAVRYINLYGGSNSDNNYIVNYMPDVVENGDTLGMPIAYHYSYVSTGVEAKLVMKTKAIVPKYEMIIPKVLTPNATLFEVEKGTTINLLNNYVSYFPSECAFKPKFSLSYAVKGVKIENDIMSISEEVRYGETFVVDCEINIKEGNMPYNTELPAPIRLSFKIKDTISHTIVDVSKLSDVSENSDLSKIKKLTINVDTLSGLIRFNVPITMTEIEIVGKNAPYSDINTPEELQAKSASLSTSSLDMNLSFEDRTTPFTIRLNNVILSKKSSEPIVNADGVKNILTIETIGRSGFIGTKNTSSQVLISASQLYLKSSGESACVFYGNNPNSAIIRSVNNLDTYKQDGNGKFVFNGINEFDKTAVSLTFEYSGEMNNIPFGQQRQITVTNVPHEEVEFKRIGGSTIIEVSKSGLVTLNNNAKKIGTEFTEIEATYKKNGMVVTREISVSTENIYDIDTVDDFEKLVGLHGKILSAVFNQRKDLNFEGEYKRGKSLSGTYLGNNHKITGINISFTGGDLSKGTGFAIFDRVESSGVVRDLKADVKITTTVHHTFQKGYAFVGGIVGMCYGTIDNCSVSGSIEVHRYESCVGGVVGKIYDNAVVKNCTNNAKVYSNRRTGGIAGYAQDESTIFNCTNDGEITTYRLESRGILNDSYASVGGIVGCAINKVSVTNCLNNGGLVVMNRSAPSGGIMGEKGKEVYISGCVNKGAATGKNGRYGDIYGETYKP